MTNMEKVEKLREKANVSYAEAKDALERADWDILDAMILLEKDGKVSDDQKAADSGYSTKEEASDSGSEHGSAARNGPGFGELLGRFFRWIGKVIGLGNANDFVIERNNERLLCTPVTVFVLLLVFCFWVVIPLLIVGLFFGYRYSFTGPNLGKESINNVMHKASDVAEDIKGEFREGQKSSENDRDYNEDK